MDDVVVVLLKHVSREKAIAIFRELHEVPGNASFRKTVEEIYSRLCEGEFEL
jgi:hypothetical protein